MLSSNAPSRSLVVYYTNARWRSIVPLDGRLLAIHAVWLRPAFYDLLPRGRLMAEKGKPYRTRTGKVLADEAERGHDVEALKARRRGRPMLGTAPADVVPVRLDPELKQAVDARAEADHTPTSEVIREALRRFLDVA